MLDAALRAFPPHTHPLTLVSDPDGALASPEARAALVERGFRLIERADPIELRAEVERARPFTAETPVILITPEPVNTLPYDLWQQGRHVALALSDFFPNLEPSVVRTLSPRQRDRISDAPPEQAPRTALLTHRETVVYALDRAFGFPLDAPVTPAWLLGWLADYHVNGDPLPEPLATEALARLRQEPALDGWPLEALLADKVAYKRFVQDGWQSFVRRHSALHAEGRVEESAAGVTLSFGSDVALQDALPHLVRAGAIQPVSIPGERPLPAWALVAVAGRTMDERLSAFKTDLGLLMTRVGLAARWEDWCEVALDWARLSLTHDDLRSQFSPEQRARMELAQSELDERFSLWLAGSYAPLAIQALPAPHHLFHVPGWLAARRDQRSDARIALLIFDGMSLADWLLMRKAWQARHPDWSVDQSLALAEAPSITAVSRLALVSGIRPNALAADQLKNQYEERLWREFWRGRGLPDNAAVYAHLPARTDTPYPHEIGSSHTQAICLVNTIVDEMVHGATQGAASVRASLEVWLRQRDATRPGSAWMEGLIQRLLDENYTITIASDHGHVEAVGMGAPSDGVLAQTRSKRARLYSSPDLARQAQERFPATMPLDGAWLAPMDVYPLVATGRRAFATASEIVVSHGGLTIEEMLTPLITLTKK